MRQFCAFKGFFFQIISVVVPAAPVSLNEISHPLQRQTAAAFSSDETYLTQLVIQLASLEDFIVWYFYRLRVSLDMRKFNCEVNSFFLPVLYMIITYF